MATDRSSRARRLAVLGVALAAASCVEQSVISPNAAAVIVHAVLDLSSRDQYVIVQTTNGATSSQRAVAGASVVIITPDARALSAAEEHDSTFYPVGQGEPRLTVYYHLSLDRYGAALVSGSTYQLHITLPDGREVTGTTTLPGSAPDVTLGLPQSFTRATDSLSLAWPRVSGASAYEVAISSFRSSFEAFSDTTIVVPGTATNADGTDAFFSGLAHHVVVSAVDANYYDYYRRGSDFFTGTGPISRLNGAMGVFGSIVPLGSGTLVVR